MRKRHLSVPFALLLAASVGLNIFFVLRSSPQSEEQQVVSDLNLVGSWLSTDPHGYRLILMRYGGFVLTHYGKPPSAIGTWSVDGDQIRTLWAIGDEGGIQDVSVTYVLSADGRRLSLDRDVFGLTAFEYVKSTDKP